MKNVDLYGRVRHAVLIDGMSSREAARVFGVDPRTIAKMLAFSFPPGFSFTGIIDQTLGQIIPPAQPTCTTPEVGCVYRDASRIDQTLEAEVTGRTLEAQRRSPTRD